MEYQNSQRNYQMKHNVQYIHGPSTTAKYQDLPQTKTQKEITRQHAQLTAHKRKVQNIPSTLKSTIFHQKHFHFTGYIGAYSQFHLQKLIESHGGHIVLVFRKKEVTHVITTGVAGYKVDMLKQWDGVVIRPEWILESVEVGRCVDVGKYLVFGRENGVFWGVGSEEDEGRGDDGYRERSDRDIRERDKDRDMRDRNNREDSYRGREMRDRERDDYRKAVVLGFGVKRKIEDREDEVDVGVRKKVCVEEGGVRDVLGERRFSLYRCDLSVFPKAHEYLV